MEITETSKLILAGRGKAAFRVLLTCDFIISLVIFGASFKTLTLKIR